MARIVKPNETVTTTTKPIYKTITTPDKHYLIDVSKIEAEKKMSVYAVQQDGMKHLCDIPIKSLDSLTPTAFRHLVMKSARNIESPWQSRVITTKMNQYFFDLSELSKGVIHVLTPTANGTTKPFATIKVDAKMKEKPIRLHVIKQLKVMETYLKYRSKYLQSDIKLIGTEPMVEVAEERRGAKPTNPPVKRSGAAWS